MRVILALLVALGLSGPAAAQTQETLVYVFPLWSDTPPEERPDVTQAETRFPILQDHYLGESYGRYRFATLRNFGYVQTTLPRPSGCTLTTARTQVRNLLTAQHGTLPNGLWIYVWPWGTNCNPHAQGSSVNLMFNSGPDMHEVGHALGAAHDNRVRNDSGTEVWEEYGDPHSVMGLSRSSHWSPAQKIIRGWIGPTHPQTFLTVAATSTVTVQPYETDAAGVKTIRLMTAVPQPFLTGFFRTYFVALRTILGPEVVIYRAASSPHIPAYWNTGSHFAMGAMDLDPTSALRFGLQVGETFTDQAARLSITPVAVSLTEASIRVQWIGQAARPSRPVRVRVQPS